MNTLKIKEMFLEFQNQKINQVQKIINGGESKPDLHINMTTKGPSHKQIIVSMSNKTARKYAKDTSTHIISINCILKTIKLNIMADFIYVKDKGIVISTNNVTSLSDLQKIEKCIKSPLLNDTDQISPPGLPQLKFYLKIIRIPYLNKQSNMHISSKNIEKKILKSNHIFNDIILIFRPRVIKVLLKSDMAIIWIDIWNTQNDSKAKSIINQRFNVESFSAIVCGANMNPGVLQCKNCWK